MEPGGTRSGTECGEEKEERKEVDGLGEEIEEDPHEEEAGGIDLGEDVLNVGSLRKGRVRGTHGEA